MKLAFNFTVVAAVLVCAARVSTGADGVVTFGSGANRFSIQFVTVGNPGNPPDATGSPKPAGAVPYVYNIGKTEVSREMVAKASRAGKLGITLDRMPGLMGKLRPGMPATGLSWNEAARFVNWLNTSEGHPPAYKFASQPGDEDYGALHDNQLWDPDDPGYDPDNRYRNKLARYFLPSADEWYKAAYHNPTGGYFDYTTASNEAPAPVASGKKPNTAVFTQQSPADVSAAGGLSAYRTMGQGGNVTEWEETPFESGSLRGARRGARGGAWTGPAADLLAIHRFGAPARVEAPYMGFRVASTAP
jgi:formylglycine-generating enzyme